MKNFIAVLLCFAVIFAFAACTKKASEGETTTATTLPINVITDADGNAQTTLILEKATDKNGKEVTTYRSEYVTYKAGANVTYANGDPVTATKYSYDLDENGSTMLDKNGNIRTNVAFSNVTYPPAPGETTPPKPTMPVGNTSPSENVKWPADKFMAKLPKLRDNVDKVISSSNENGNLTSIYINELSYADFLKYAEMCRKAGFVQDNASLIPESPEAGKSYNYYSVANGLYVRAIYYTDEYPYRTCDLCITVSDYDMLATLR